MQHPSKPLAKTRQGTLAGSAEQGIHIWRGIPYAAPPVGPLRWRAPQPAARWQGVRPAETFSAASWQDIDYCRELGGGDPGAFSEDCLYLNVWAPASAAQPLPVMVWLHGGGFTIGAGSLPPYDGKALASRDVVVVTVNYRLAISVFSPIRRWNKRRANVSIISRCSIRLPLCSGFRRISTPSAGMPPTSRCLANPPGRAACCR